MTDTNTLSPCPFCGERAETDFIPEHHSYQIECSDVFGCTARVTRDSELGAVEAWNLRAPALAAPAQPVGWAIFAENGNCRMWTQNKSHAEVAAKDTGLQLTALYAAPQPAAQALDAIRYQFLRDGEWRDTELEPFIRLQLNTMWDAKIDAAIAAQQQGRHESVLGHHGKRHGLRAKPLQPEERKGSGARIFCQPL